MRSNPSVWTLFCFVELIKYNLVQHLGLPMKKFYWVLMVFLSLEISANTNAQHAAQRERLIENVNAENLEQTISLFAPKAQLMLQTNSTIKGRANIRLYFDAFFEHFDITQYQRNTIETLDLGSKLVEIGTYTLTMKNPQQTVREITGSYLSLWSNDNNKEVKISIELWNFDHPVNFSHELRFKNVPTVTTALEPHLPISSPATLEVSAYASLIKESVLLRDGNVLSQFYTQDGVILRNSSPAIVGKSAIKHYWDKHAVEIASMEGLQQRTLALEAVGKYLIQQSAHIAIWRSGIHSGVNTGKHIRIWERQADGRIKTRILASAYDN